MTIRDETDKGHINNCSEEIELPEALTNRDLRIFITPYPNQIKSYDVEITNASEGFVLVLDTDQITGFLRLRERFINSVGRIGIEFLQESSLPVVTGYASVEGEGFVNFIITRKKDYGNEKYLVFEICDGEYVRVFEICDITDYRYTGNVVLD